MTDLRGLCLLTVFALLGATASAECVPTPARTVFEEQQRIGQCLETVARAPVRDSQDERYNEVRLYTWGPKVKIERMLDDPYFCDYEFERQREYELRNLSRAWSKNTTPWYEPGRVTGIHEIAALDIPRADKQALSLLFVFDGMNKSGMTPETRNAEIKQALADLEERPNIVEEARWRGREAAQAMPPESRPSSIKTGRGVYFATDLFTFFSPVDQRVEGLVCDIPDAARIVDLTREDTLKKLETNAIWHRNPSDLFGSEIVPFINNPRLFDAAARNQHIVRARFPFTDDPERQVWVDKCSITYQQCRPVSMAESDLSCRDFRRLLGIEQRDNGDWIAAEKPLVVRDELLDVFTASGKAAENFRARLKSCYSSKNGVGLADALKKAGREPLVKAFLPASGK